MEYEFDEVGDLLLGIYESDEGSLIKTFCLFSKRRQALCQNFKLLILDPLIKITQKPFFIIFYGSFVNSKKEIPGDIDIEIFLSDNDLRCLKYPDDEPYHRFKDAYYDNFGIHVNDITSYEAPNFQEYFDEKRDELWCNDDLSDKKKGAVKIWFNNI